MTVSASKTAQQLKYIKDSIKTIPDYPKAGILFRDVTSLLENPKAYSASIKLLSEHYSESGVTKVVGTEARGFFVWCPGGTGAGGRFCSGA